MQTSAAGQVTRFLHAAADGDSSAARDLLILLYDELRTLAQRQLKGERADHTLQPTALVHEAYLKLLQQDTVGFRDRAQFFGAAANMMRRILIDHARSRLRTKRGGGAPRMRLDDVVAAFEERSIDLIALDEALEALAERDPRKASLVELRFFAGLGVEDAAQILGISLRTAERDWMLTRAWLRSALEEHRSEPER
jgi:RNA polymerase sigma factor (TIGR02999 family)